MFKCKQRWIKAILVLVLFVPSPAFAQTSSSPNYRVDQTFFGSGGELDQQSASYGARSALGELGIGLSESTLYRIYAGFTTTEEPYIEFVVTGQNINLGYLQTSATSTANGQFYVRAWQAGGYAVRTMSDPPTNQNGGYQLNALASPTASSSGTEQFGINLVANTCPSPSVSCNNPFGAVPQQSPDGTFSFGTAATGYNTANQFKYVENDVIASAAESTSVTIYTISYIFNISEVTPAGQYNFNHILVATGQY